VKSRRNHYEILGLKPGATDDEIAAAFATESRKIIQNPRVNEPDVREKARRVRTAHQTLRDPVKRAAYDASIGVAAKQQAEVPPTPVEPGVRPFVAATSDQPKADPVVPAAGDEHVAQDHAEPAKGRSTARGRAARPRPEGQTNARTGLPEGLFVAAMAAKAASKAPPSTEDQTPPTEDQTPASQAEPAPPASEPEAPFVAPQANDGPATETADSATAPPPQPEEAPEDTAAEPAAEPAYRFEDPGADAADYYGERRERKVNRAAAGGLAALAAALAVGAFWLWPSENSVAPTSNAPAGSQVADAGETGVPPDVLNGLPPEQALTDEPFADTEMADVGSYQSVTFADSGPIPTVGAPPSAAAPPSASGPTAGETAASPPAAAEPGKPNETAPAPATTTAAAAPPSATPALPAAGTSVAANVPRRAQPAPDLRPVTPPKLVRGTILNSDNRRGAFQGTVSVRFTVGANGRPTGCTPTASSGNPRLDTYTCELVQRRLQFAPATTAQGQPVASEMRATYTWGRKRRSLTGRLLDIVR
jgi:protein TonB